jgi:uncharacterized membrane protein YhhN
MITKTEKKFSLFFLMIVISELIFDNIESLKPTHYITKPAIIISLIFFFLNKSNHLDNKTKFLTLFALIFSLLGDILLMFTTKSINFFMGGLIAFLLAHIFYIFVFLKRKNYAKKSIITIIILLIYGLGILNFLKDGLGDLLVPVIMYMLVILMMVIFAFLRYGKVPEISFNFVFFGAVLFIISDSLLALNKFYMHFQLSDILIILTYAIAQYLIVLGIKKQ